MATTSVIQNQYDGPRAPAKRRPEGQISLDYIDSNSAAEIDAGIRESIKGVRMSIVAMGLGLAKLKAKGLYVDLKFHSMNDYLESLCDEMQIERSTAHNWLYIVQAGEALEAGEVLYTTRLYDMDELRRFERGAEKMKKEMRKKR